MEGKGILDFFLIRSRAVASSGEAQNGQQKGQSTIEFLLTIVLLLAFTLFFFQVSMIFAFGNFVHYATFMSARSYLAAGNSTQDQFDRAKKVMGRTVKRSENMTGIDRFPSIARGDGDGDPRGVEIGPGSNYIDGNRDLSWMQGVRYTFRSRLYLLPLAGRFDRSLQNFVKLTSESWLGKEPSAEECRRAIKGIYDNGC